MYGSLRSCEVKKASLRGTSLQQKELQYIGSPTRDCLNPSIMRIMKYFLSVDNSQFMSFALLPRVAPSQDTPSFSVHGSHSTT